MHRKSICLIAVILLLVSLLVCSCGGDAAGPGEGEGDSGTVETGEAGPGGYYWQKEYEVKLDLNDVLALDAEHVWAVGNGGIYFYDGSGWELQYSEGDPAIMSPGDQRFWRLAACDSTHVWAVSWWEESSTSSGGRIYFFDGEEWEVELETEEMLIDITVAAEDSAWAVGNYSYEDAETLELYAARYFFDGEEWEKSVIDFESYSSDTGFRSITSADESHVWESWVQSVYFYDGSAWSKQAGDLAPNGILLGISAADPNHVWSFSSDARIYFYDGSLWTEQEGVQEPLSDISAYEPDRVWAASNDGNVYLLDGASWQLMYQAEERLTRDFSVSAAGTGDVWAVGGYGIYHGSK